MNRPGRRSTTNPPIALHDNTSDSSSLLDPQPPRRFYGATASARGTVSQNQAEPQPYQIPLDILIKKGSKRFNLNMRRFILSTLGVPNIPGMSPEARTKCSESTIIYRCCQAMGAHNIHVCIYLTVNMHSGRFS